MPARIKGETDIALMAIVGETMKNKATTLPESRSSLSPAYIVNTSTKYSYAICGWENVTSPPLLPKSA